MTKMITAANPNVEVLGVDKGSNQIRLRDKQTGQSYTISFDDAKKGKFFRACGTAQAGPHSPLAVKPMCPVGCRIIRGPIRRLLSPRRGITARAAPSLLKPKTRRIK